MNEKKGRREVISFQTVNEEDGVTIRVDTAGRIDVVEGIERANVRIEYDRPKGPKVLASVPTGTSGMPFEPNNALRAYDHLVAVDTNTREIGGQRVSITGIVLAEWTSPQREEVRYYAAPFAFEARDCSLLPERLGWVLALYDLRKEGLVPASGHLGVIVDSDLDQLPAINSRAAPILADSKLMLLPGMQLIYASADSGAEIMSNFLIRRADRLSAAVLDQIQRGIIPAPTRTTARRDYSSLRRLRVKTVE